MNLSRTEQQVFDNLEQNILLNRGEHTAVGFDSYDGVQLRHLDGTAPQETKALFRLNGEHMTYQFKNLTGLAAPRELWWHAPKLEKDYDYVDVTKPVEEQVEDTERVFGLPFLKRAVIRTITMEITEKQSKWIGWKQSSEQCLDVATGKEHPTGQVAYWLDIEPYRSALLAEVPLYLAEQFHGIALEKPNAARLLGHNVINKVVESIYGSRTSGRERASPSGNGAHLELPSQPNWPLTIAAGSNHSPFEVTSSLVVQPQDRK